MNEYREAMSHCAPPEDLEGRLEQRVLWAAATRKQTAIRPLSFARKGLLAAVLAVLVLAVGAGAAKLVNWDGIFENAFGRESAASPVTATAFQQVGVTSACDDVTLTVREALGDSKTIYMILDYQVPETVDREWLRESWERSGPVELIDVGYYAAGDWDWERLKEAEDSLWAGKDWADFTWRNTYFGHHCSLYGERFPGGGGSMISAEGYNAETGTMTFMLMFNTDSKEKSLQDQPLTLVVLPPAMEREGEVVPLADHPALITFQPEYTAKVRTGGVTAEDKSYMVGVKVSPFTVAVDYYGSGYMELEEIRGDTVLVLADGTELSVTELTQGYGGSRSVNEKFEKIRLSYDSQFTEVFDAGSVELVRLGDIEIPLTGEE